MIISDLSHLEVVSEETNIEGGIVGYYVAFADAFAGAANPTQLGSTFSGTTTGAVADYAGGFTSSGSSSTASVNPV